MSSKHTTDILECNFLQVLSSITNDITVLTLYYGFEGNILSFEKIDLGSIP